MKIFDSPPYAPMLMESTRAIGYTIEAAVADIIDNSITAQARNISIKFMTVDEPYIAVLDDGQGMSFDELKEAMNYGSCDPSQERDEADLGRYGLGLKTASLLYATWFRLARKTDVTKLCRVKVDLPNSLDTEWSLDIKKSAAHPPEVVVQAMQRIVGQILGSSRRVYTFRGRKEIGAEKEKLWQPEVTRNGNLAEDALPKTFEEALNTDFAETMEAILSNNHLKDIFSFCFVLFNFCKSKISYLKAVRNIVLKTFLVYDFLYHKSIELSEADYDILSEATIDIYKHDPHLFCELINREGRNKFCGDFFINLIAKALDNKYAKELINDFFANLPYQIDIAYNSETKSSIDKFCVDIDKDREHSCFEVVATTLYNQYKQYIGYLKRKEYGGISISIYVNVLLNGLCNYYDTNRISFISDLDILISTYENWVQKWHADYSNFHKEYFVLMNQFHMLAIVSQNVALLSNTHHIEQKTTLEKITAMQFRYESLWRNFQTPLGVAQWLDFKFTDD